MVNTELITQKVQLTKGEMLLLVTKVENWKVIGRWDYRKYDNKYSGSIGELTFELSHRNLDVIRDNSLLGYIYDRGFTTIPQLDMLYKTLEDEHQKVYEYLEKLEEDRRNTEKKNRKLAEEEEKRKEERLNRLKEIENIEYALSLI